MKHLITILILTVFISSCNKYLKPGTYRFKNDSQILIKENNLYEFKSLDRSQPFRFSKGTYQIKNSVVTFSPDSNYLMSIVAKHAYFDPALTGKKKIVLINPKNELKDFEFYFTNTISDTNYFDRANYTEIIDNKTYGRTQIALGARLNDSIENIMPGYFKRTIISNVIDFGDVYFEFKKWNVIEIYVHINQLMFGFTLVDKYQLNKGKLAKLNWPVYKFLNMNATK